MYLLVLQLSLEFFFINLLARRKSDAEKIKNSNEFLDKNKPTMRLQKMCRIRNVFISIHFFTDNCLSDDNDVIDMKLEIIN